MSHRSYRSYSYFSPAIRTALILFAAAVSWVATANAQQGAASPVKPVSAATPIPLVKIRLEAQSAMNTLQTLEASASMEQAELGVATNKLYTLKNEIETKMGEDASILASSPSLDLLFRLKQIWVSFGNTIFLFNRDLAPRAAALEQAFEGLDQSKVIWSATFELTKQSDVPPQVSQLARSVLDSIDKAKGTVELAASQVWALQNSLSVEEARVHTAFALIEKSQNAALKSIFVRDRPPIWSLNLGSEWERQGGDSFSSQFDTSIAFSKRLPFSFLTHALIILAIVILIRWMKGRIQKSAEGKPDLQRALPILELPFAAAFVLSLLFTPSVYAPAPRLIQAIMGLVALIPSIVILRRLLEPSLFQVLSALAAMYFVEQLRIIVATLPALQRFLFLAQMLGGSLFLLWQLRYWRSTALPRNAADWLYPALRVIATVGLFFLPAAFIANIFGFVNLGNLSGTIYLRSVFLLAMFYAAIRIFEGLLIIALQVRPLGSLQVVRLHRLMLQKRICRGLEVLSILVWLGLMLNFFGFLTPIFNTAGMVLKASFAVGSIKISLGPVLSFVIAVWSSFLISGFLRFLLEEDVYQHFHLQRGVPYAISTVLHYVILLSGLFIGIGALGIDLTKITILAGAFSVGIGFGLQNVINNFVSGLILLFERPIKIGDVIEVTGTLGEVKRIGIRASVIRTADGSEVIVPNGSLISSQVTNWTFSDRNRAIEISVSVVRGTDPERVVELLKKTAVDCPGVARDPEPQVYVVGFAGGAINLQLRAWTDLYRDWAQLRSDLSVAVNATLDHENIAIP